MRIKLLIVLLWAIAAVLIAIHLRVPQPVQVWRLDAPVARVHSADAPFSLPQGEVDVNAADAQALQALAGVGPVLAQEIVAEREANGSYHYPEDLINVKGIGEKTLEKMREQLNFP